MSNLRLPDLSFENLDKLAKPATGGHGGPNTKIGYETQIYRFHDEICIQHHGTTVASVGANSVHITPHGWASSTTAARLRKVMQDNGLTSRYVIRIHQGELVVEYPSRNRFPVPAHGVYFQRIAGVWAQWIREDDANFPPFQGRKLGWFTAAKRIEQP